MMQKPIVDLLWAKLLATFCSNIISVRSEGLFRFLTSLFPPGGRMFSCNKIMPFSLEFPWELQVFFLKYSSSYMNVIYSVSLSQQYLYYLCNSLFSYKCTSLYIPIIYYC